MVAGEKDDINIEERYPEPREHGTSAPVVVNFRRESSGPMGAMPNGFVCETLHTAQIQIHDGTAERTTGLGGTTAAKYDRF